MVGLFVNTLPTRVPVEPDELLFPWLKRIQADQVASREYEWSSLIDIQGWSDVPRGVPLFEGILVFENWEADALWSHWSDDLAIRDVRWVNSGTGYPLTVLVAPGPRLSLAFSFDERRFDPPRDPSDAGTPPHHPGKHGGRTRATRFIDPDAHSRRAPSHSRRME